MTHLIICCEDSRDAQRTMDVFDKRLGKFKLKLNEDKTKVVPFSKAKARIGIQQGTFDFLGFTFHLGRSKRGIVIPKVKTARKRFVTKMKRVTKWAKENRNKHKLAPLWKTFCAKLRGHIQYYGVSHNYEQVKAFVEEAKRIFFKWINRRSQKKSMKWEKFMRFCEKHPLPVVTIKHRLF